MKNNKIKNSYSSKSNP